MPVATTRYPSEALPPRSVASSRLFGRDYRGSRGLRRRANDFCRFAAAIRLARWLIGEMHALPPLRGKLRLDVAVVFHDDFGDDVRVGRLAACCGGEYQRGQECVDSSPSIEKTLHDIPFACEPPVVALPAAPSLHAAEISESRSNSLYECRRPAGSPLGCTNQTAAAPACSHGPDCHVFSISSLRTYERGRSSLVLTRFFEPA